ncbi:hypothetical protein Q4F19_16120 [Sphingomonas sp. BIUV-7]|uniref:Invasion protein IalB, involved in pathogenesis n=1 Tax=Sphingomonas natans TaxID=3063330 RepID=A0ABT8YDQ6_9SPHN|nr:hypothetical protein [Sphingomonas sp. BIUV-7]MDO6415918.1 hypothetical protein [Sphingomonas sp. BIUV-7]
MKRRAAGMMMMLAPWLAAAAGAPQSLGQFGRWGAFRAGDPVRCYAIAQPARSGKADAAFLTISSWPARRLFRQVHVRLRGAAEPGAVLAIGERRFPLVTKEADGWPSAGDGRRIALFLREGEAVRVTARIRGRRITDVYPGAGAASAIDAADLACLRGR